MAKRSQPTPRDADNCSGRLWRAACNDRYRSDAEFHVGTGGNTTEAQLDAGYTTAGVPVTSQAMDQSLALVGESIYLQLGWCAEERTLRTNYAPSLVSRKIKNSQKTDY